ncbi:hypothetical protein AACH06_27190 [Ideonella sp. DXS29W]|uniref:Uncharacterized protein n=1 Tax=Ideonella lacteola TaxID=2984193 RepID=A0ABU9BXE6_9BURK
MNPSQLTTRPRLAGLFAAVASAAIVAGCGGGGGDGPTPPPPPPPPPASDQVPASAFASPESLFSFALEQTSEANTLETSEPLMFDLVTTEPPTSDDSEPSALG